MSSLVPLVKQYFVTMEEVGNQYKITRQCCNSFSTCKVIIVELIYIIFLRCGLSALGIYTVELDPEIFYFQCHARTKIQRMYQKFFKGGNGCY